MKRIIFLLILSYGTISAQSGIVVAGESLNKEGSGSVSFSIGQIFFQSYRDGPERYDLNEGVQHAYEFDLKSVEPDDPIVQEIHGHLTDSDDFQSNLEVNVFPNPFTQFLTLALEEEPLDMSYHVYDVIGNLIYRSSLTQRETIIDFTNFDNESSIFYLTLTSQDKPLKTIKIIKQKR